MKICMIGASGKLGTYVVQHVLDRGHEVVGVCRERSVSKLEAFKGRITVIPGATNDRQAPTTSPPSSGKPGIHRFHPPIRRFVPAWRLTTGESVEARVDIGVRGIVQVFF